MVGDCHAAANPAAKTKHSIYIQGSSQMAAVVNKDTCTGCGACVDTCPVDAIEMDGDVAVVSDACIDCGQCVDECPVEAISME
jgi:NAD-dependent dihydropyrimidine dehydrogenase PreA subunit